ncbi:hypothetical protein ACSFV5_03280 [Acinetobacter sp. HC8-3S]
MDPRSEVVLRQQDYLTGQVLLINAPNDQLAKIYQLKYKHLFGVGIMLITKAF